MGHIDVIKSVFLALFGAFFFCTLALGEPVGGAARDAAGDPAGADKQVTEEVVEVDDIDDSAAGIESCSQSTQPPPGVAPSRDGPGAQGRRAILLAKAPGARPQVGPLVCHVGLVSMW